MGRHAGAGRHPSKSLQDAAVEGWHGHTYPALFDQGLEVLQKQGAKQGGDMGAVRVGVGQDADFAVAQALHLADTGVHADGH